MSSPFEPCTDACVGTQPTAPLAIRTLQQMNEPQSNYHLPWFAQDGDGNAASGTPDEETQSDGTSGAQPQEDHEADTDAPTGGGPPS
ncbi:MAG: hypothetical protein AAF604_22545 [Acidobacteriota bacterium]